MLYDWNHDVGKTNYDSRLKMNVFRSRCLDSFAKGRMKFAFILFTLLSSVAVYGVSVIPFTLWQWIEILIGFSVFASIVLPYFAAWIINLLFKKKKRFSLSCEKLSPFGFYAKNLVFQTDIKCFHIRVTLKKVAVRTNLKKALFGVSASSLFILEFDSIAVEIVGQRNNDVAKEEAIPETETASPMPSLLKNIGIYQSESITSQLVSDSDSKLSKTFRYLVPFLRLLDLHVINTIVTVGTSEFPNRVELCISDVTMNGNAQYTPTTSLGLNLKVQTVSLSNCENAFDGQPNVMVCNFWFHANMELNRRIIVKEFSLNLGDSFHVRLDKSLRRQLGAIMKALPPKREKKRVEESNPRPPFDKLKYLILLLPRSMKIAAPKLELDLINADKSGSHLHNDVHISMGWIVKCSPMYYDVFCTKPKGLSLIVESTRIRSNWVNCYGVAATVECVLRENQPLFESVKILYSHKPTVVTLHPSLFRTVEYIQSMMTNLARSPSARAPKRVKHVARPEGSSVLALFSECSFKVDFRIESITLGVCASPIVSSPQLEASIHSFSITFTPSSLRSSTDTLWTTHELQVKLALIELQNAPISRVSLEDVLKKAGESGTGDDVRICPCTDKVLSLRNVECSCPITKWEKVSVDASLRSSNVVLDCQMIDMMLFVVELYRKEWSEYCQRRKESGSLMKNVASSDSFSSLSTPPVSEVVENNSVPLPKSALGDDESFIQSILNGSLLPEKLEAFESEAVETPPKLPSPEALTDSSSDSEESDEILLSDHENAIDSYSHEPKCLPLFLSGITVHITNTELQVTGLDSSRTASYSVEVFTLSLTSKSVDSIEKLTLDSSPALAQEPSPEPKPYLETPVALTSIASNSELNSPTASTPPHPSFLRCNSLDLQSIPSFNDDTSLPVSPPLFTLGAKTERRLPIYTPAPLPVFSSHSDKYVQNACIQYTLTLEISNISVIGDEGTHTPKNHLPLFIPQIRLTLPSLVFLVIPQHQQPVQYSALSFAVQSTHYSPFSLRHYAGFKRDDAMCLLLANDNPVLNTVQLLVTSPCAHLSYGSIYIIYHSFVEILALAKTSLAKRAGDEKISPKDEASAKDESTASKNQGSPKSKSSAKEKRVKPSLFPLSRLHFSFTLTHLSASLVFSPEQGIMATINEISAVYPDSSSYPLVYVSMVQVSLIAEWRIKYIMGSIERITCYSPSAYSDVRGLRDLETVEKEIDSMKEEVGDLYKDYVKSNKWGDFVFCPTCQKCTSSECNGYSNHCNRHHVPANVTPFILLLSSVNLFQDRQDAWGDLFYEATVQWKAFKTLRKGDKKPAPFPHPDEARVATVAEHAELEEGAYAKGLWAMVIVDSLCLRLNDVLPEYSPDSCEYSRLVVTGVNGVISYNPALHSRSHLLQFMQAMDEVPTPLQKGFDDVIGLHLHDVYINSIATDFGELLPPLVVADSVFVCGTLVVAEMNRVQRFVVYNDVESYCSSTFDPIPVRISRSSTSMKWFQNLAVQAKQIEVNWGTPLNHVRDSFSHCMGDLTPRGVSKSPKLPFFDKIRFNLHGPLVLHVSELFRVNWITNKSANALYEALVIDLNKSDWLFKKEGGTECGFDVFSIGFARLDAFNQLVLNPFIEAVDGEWVVDLLWANTRPLDHYVELIEEVTDKDKYEFYRSHQIEWTIKLQPLPRRVFNVSFFLRCEMADFALDFKDYIFSSDPSTPVDKTVGLMRISTVFLVEMKLPNSSAWVCVVGCVVTRRFINDESVNGVNAIAKNLDISVTMYKLFPNYLEKEGRELMNCTSKPDYSSISPDFALTRRPEVRLRHLLELQVDLSPHLHNHRGPREQPPVARTAHRVPAGAAALHAVLPPRARVGDAGRAPDQDRHSEGREPVVVGVRRGLRGHVQRQDPECEWAHRGEERGQVRRVHEGREDRVLAGRARRADDGGCGEWV